MKSKQKGTDFEIFVKIACEAYHNDKLKDRNITIKHNVTLKGKSVSCQFDLYWEDVGITKTTYAVECKDHKAKIKVNQIRDFADKLQDCNISKGMFISRNGFQKGAIKRAKNSDIDLFIIRESSDIEYFDLSFDSLSFQNKFLHNRLDIDIFDPPYIRNNYFNNSLWGYGNIHDLNYCEVSKPEPRIKFHASEVHSILTKIPSVQSKFSSEGLYSSIIIYKSSDGTVFCNSREHIRLENVHY